MFGKVSRLVRAACAAALCVSLAFPTADSAFAAELLQDDFNDGDAQGWDTVYGTWAVVDNHFASFSEAGGPVVDDSPRAMTGQLSWSVYTYQARMKLVLQEGEAWNDFGLIFYAQDDTNYLRFTLGAEDTGNPRITYCSEGNSEDLGGLLAYPSMVSGRWYAITLVLDGQNLSAYVDGELVAATGNLPYDHGYIGLTADDPLAYFDDIVVVGEPVTLPGDANGDGVVDAADYIAVKRHMSQATGASLPDGDFDDDGDVDRRDLMTLTSAMNTAAGQSPVVPEPATLCLLALGAAVFLRRRSKSF